MQRKDAIRLIQQAYRALPDNIRPSLGRPVMHQHLYTLALASEKEHRRFIEVPTPADFTANTAAKFFVVKSLANPKNRDYVVTDLLRYREVVLWAAAYALEYEAEIAAAWNNAGVAWANLQDIDYAKLLAGEDDV
jgi:hypothetical protein